MKKLLLLTTLVFNLCFVQDFVIPITNPVKTEYVSYNSCSAQSTFFGVNSIPSTFDVDYQNVLRAAIADGTGLPSPTCMVAQNQMMIDVKATIGLNRFDQFKPLKTDAPSRFTDFNWVNPALHRTVQTNNPLYVPLKGFQNSGVGSAGSSSECLNMGVLSSSNFTLNSCEIIYYFSDQSGFGNNLEGTQVTTGTTNVLVFNPQSSSASGGTVKVGINESASNNVTGFDATDGLYYFGRTNSSTGFVRKGSASRTTYSTSTTSLVPYEYLVGGRNNDNGSYQSTNLTSRIVGFFASGPLLTTTEEASLKTAWDTYVTAISGLSYPTIGTKYNVTGSSWSNLNDFTSNGCTVSVSSGKLHFTGGANTFTQSLDLTSIAGTAIGAHKFSRWTQTLKFIVPTLSASTSWIGVGLRSSNPSAFQDALIRMELVSTANKGLVRLYTTPSHSLQAATTAVSITAGDEVSMTLSVVDGNFLFSAFNVTTSSAVVTRNFEGYGTSFGFITNTGHFAIFDGGGSVNPIDVTSWTVTIDDLVNPTFAICSDSKTQAYKAFNLNSPSYGLHGGYFYILKDYLTNSIVNLGGSNDSSNEYLSQVWSIINWVNPRYLILPSVVNDIGHGTWPTPAQSNLASIISQCQAAGIKVIFLDGFYSTTTDQSSVTTWANAGIGCDVYNTNTIVLDLADGEHMTNAGALKAGRMVRDILTKYPK